MWFETIKTLGAMAGLFTAAFTIYDRLFRRRPTLQLSLIYGGRLITVKLINFTNQPVVVNGFHSFPPYYKVLQSLHTRHLIAGLMGQPFMDFVSPKEEANYPLHVEEKEIANARLPFSIVWLSWSRPSSLLPALPCVMILRHAKIEQLRNHANTSVHEKYAEDD